jgi:hypothetical protein
MGGVDGVDAVLEFIPLLIIPWLTGAHMSICGYKTALNERGYYQLKLEDMEQSEALT